jgi:hypothetical protein
MRAAALLGLATLALAPAAACSARQPPLAAPERGEIVDGRAPSRGAAEPTASQAPRAPIGGHPRLWLTAADLPKLRRWATSSNPVYAEGLIPMLKEELAKYERFFPGGKPADPFPDPGGATLVMTPLENTAVVLAFMSVVNPDPAKRADYAGRARNLLMYAIDRAALGAAPGQPFRDPTFAWKDRARWSGATWPLIVDWIYPYLSAADKAKIRTVFVRWAAEQVEAFSHTRPAGVRNNPDLTRDRNQLRWAANNYYQAGGRNLLLEAAALDPADDPGGQLAAYADESIGGFLYQTYHLFDAGDASGGVPVEGAFFYGAEATGFTTMWLLALETAGYADPSRNGEQVKLGRSAYWERMLEFYPNAISPAAEVLPAVKYLGPVFWAAQLEQTENEIATAGQLIQLAPIGLLARIHGNRELEERVRWYVTHALPGGKRAVPTRAAKGDPAAAILSFLLLDPGSPAPVDYRPKLQPYFYSPAQRRLEARSSWNADASWFGYTCNWKTIDHQTDVCNSFHFFRKGEWLTKPRTGYSNTGILDSPDYWNATSVQNDRVDVGGWQQVAYDRGGPPRGGVGDPSAVVSVDGNYAYAEGDATNLYVLASSPGQDIVHVSRGIFWLKPDTIVTYDRDVTKTAGRFKRYNLCLPEAARIAGATATAKTPRGQLLRVDALLPEGATISDQPWEKDNLLANPEPMGARIRIEPDPRQPTPTSVRFLTVLQASDGRDPGRPTLIRATGASAFEGVVVGTNAVLFRVAPERLADASLSLTLPRGVSRVFVAGLPPGSRYAVARSGDTVKIGAGTAVAADAGGVLAF